MQHLNFELKAHSRRVDEIRAWLLSNGAEAHGTDFQTDTYFNLPSGNGRLKLRQGNIENSLIHYRRPDHPEARVSDVALSPVADGEALKKLLSRALGVKVEVRKKREIYFIGNVKFHLDELRNLGQFVEIEAIATLPEHHVECLKNQCTRYMEIFGIRPEDVLAESYSDMLLRKTNDDMV